MAYHLTWKALHIKRDKHHLYFWNLSKYKTYEKKLGGTWHNMSPASPTKLRPCTWIQWITGLQPSHFHKQTIAERLWRWQSELDVMAKWLRDICSFFNVSSLISHNEAVNNCTMSNTLINLLLQVSRLPTLKFRISELSLSLLLSVYCWFYNRYVVVRRKL